MNATGPTIGLALSGSGNRSAFYIGFLEKLDEAGIRPNYITACSGGSVVASAYAAGQLDRFKKDFLALKKEDLVNYLTSKRGKAGLFSLDIAEVIVRRYTQGLTFEASPIKMDFMAVDLNSGEMVDLCMGDIARAARISCTMPGIFEAVEWGNRTLVDGGLLCLVPLDALKRFNPDITIGIDMRATPNIFTATHINIKKFINWVKRMFFIDEIKEMVIGKSTGEFKRGLFSVLGRSLDLVISAQRRGLKEDRACDLMIEPDFPRMRTTDMSQNTMQYYYEMGLNTAEEYLPRIRGVIYQKMNPKIEGIEKSGRLRTKPAIL